MAFLGRYFFSSRISGALLVTASPLLKTPYSYFSIIIEQGDCNRFWYAVSQ